mgnify:CR=1 FL=1
MTMKLMIPIRVTADEARLFIERMEYQGFEARSDGSYTCFYLDDRLDINHSVTICDDVAYISVRPPENI